MTELSFVISQNWIFPFIYAAFFWGLLFMYRKSYKNEREIKNQVATGFLTSIFGSIGDVIGTTFNLWHFPNGDVPAIIIVIYFFAGMLGYNMIKLIEKYM